MKIALDKKLRTLQDEFNRYYPFLSIEFYAGAHQYGQWSNEKDLLNIELSVGAVNPNCTPGTISLDRTQKVGDFEQAFFRQFGLNVQVFRKSREKWLQTWATDMWTLEEQNNRGRLLTEHFAIQK